MATFLYRLAASVRNRTEGTFDDVGGSQVLPVGLGKVVECHHTVPIVLEDIDGVWTLAAKPFGELITTFRRFLTREKLAAELRIASSRPSQSRKENQD